MPATAKVIELKGNPKNPESAEHIIIFPGGSISVCRTSNNEYWAHIEVNKDGEIIDESFRQSAYGEIYDTRIDREHKAGSGIDEIPDPGTVQHIAVLVRTHKEKP